jgi:hypothetical protein
MGMVSEREKPSATQAEAVAQRAEEPVRGDGVSVAAALVSLGRPPPLSPRVVLALQQTAGNALVSRLVARQTATQAPPRSYTPGDLLPELVRAALVGGLAGAGTAGFVTSLQAAVGRHFMGPGVAEAQGRVARLAQVTAELEGRPFDYVSAAEFLALITGLPAELGAARSYGTDLYLRTVAREAGQYVAAALQPDVASLDIGGLSAHLEWVIAEWGTPTGVLELELEGSLDALVAARLAFAAAKDDTGRAAAGLQIGRISRRLLLLDDSLHRLRAPDAAPAATGPLEQRLAGVRGQIDQIRTLEADEAATRTELGDDVSLLTGRTVQGPRRLAPGIEGTAVAPEEALPHATDAASERLLGELVERVATQGRQVAALRESVVPTKPRYTLDELAGVLVRWWDFMGPAGRDRDPFWRSLTEFYDGMMEAASHGGTEGGVLRVLLMRILEPNVAQLLPTASADFADEVGRAGPHRASALGGTAAAPDYRYAERFRAGPEGRTDAAGEAQSRESAVRREGEATTTAFRKAQQERPVGGTVFLSDEARHGWSYLVRTHDVYGDETREERSMRPEVARYLLARTQQLRTLEHAHRPGIGDAGMRSGGVEATTGSAVATYERGEASPRNPTVEGMRGRLEGARTAAGAERRPSATGAQERAVEELLRAFDAYVDGFLRAHPEPEWRVAVVLQVAQVEYDIVAAFMKELTPAAIAKAIAIAAAVAGAQGALNRLGRPGQLAAQALGRLLKHAGLTDAAAAIGIIAWVHQASTAATFRDARVKAFFARTVATDFGQLIQGAIAGIVVAVKGLHGAKEPRTVDELMRAVEPILTDKAAREEFRSSVEAELAAKRAQAARGGKPDPELERLQAMIDYLDGRSAPDRPSPDQVPLTGAPAERTSQGTPRGSGDGKPPAPGTPEYAGAQHEGWVQAMRDLRPRPAAKPGGPPRKPGEIGRFHSAAAAYAAYESALGSTPGREIGVFRNTRTGEYAVIVGTEQSVREPLSEGPWDGVVHYHPNPANVLTFRMPAPRDVELAGVAAVRANQSVTEFVEFPLPGEGRGRTAYTVNPTGEVIIEIRRGDAPPEIRRYPTLGHYVSAYGDRKRFLDPSSPEYEWVMRDIEEYFAHRGGEPRKRTTQGTGDPKAVADAWLKTLYDGLDPAAQAEMDVLRTTHPDPLEFKAFLEARGDPRRFIEGRARRAAPAVREAAADARRADLQRRLDAAGFFARPDVQSAIRDRDVRRVRSEMAAAIGAAEAVARYPSDHQVLTGIQIVEDTGMTSLAQWRAANPDRPANMAYEADGKVFIRIAELDVLVLKTAAGAGGRNSIAEMEEVKSGTQDSASEAREQIGRAKDLLATRVATDYPRVQVHNRHRDITPTLDAASASNAGAFTRGPVRGKGPSAFDRTLGVTTEDLDRLAKATIDAGGAPVVK